MLAGNLLMGVNAFLNTIFLFNLNSYHAQNLYRGLAYLLKSTVGEAASISLTSKSYCLLEKQFEICCRFTVRKT